MFNANTIDGLTYEQYNILIMLWNKMAEERANSKGIETDRFTTSISSIDGLDGVNYGDD